MNIEHLIDLAAKAAHEAYRRTLHGGETCPREPAGCVRCGSAWELSDEYVRDLARIQVRPAVEAIAPLLDCGLTNAERDAARIADPLHGHCRNREQDCAACDEWDSGCEIDRLQRRLNTMEKERDELRSISARLIANATADAVCAERLSETIQKMLDAARKVCDEMSPTTAANLVLYAVERAAREAGET